MLPLILLASTFWFPGDNANAAAPQEKPALRSYSSALSLRGEEVVRLEVNSPRIDAKELDSMLVKNEILTALNQKHLSNLGWMKVRRNFQVGNDVFGVGDYALGIAMDTNGSITLQLRDRDGAVNSIAMTSNRCENATTNAVFAFLPEEDLDLFQIEVRIGNYRATTKLDFSAKRMIVHMNNTAHELLAKENRSQKDVVRALFFASRANAMTSERNPLVLDTYALALYQSGQVDKAIETQRRAIQLIDPSYETHRTALTGRLKAYQTAKKN